MPISLIVDEKDQELPGDPDSTIASLREAVTAEPDITTTTPEVKPAPVEPDIPEKYRGKSIEDVIEMHRNLERQYGRMTNDLGEQRRLTDQLLELKREQDLAKNTPEVPEITSGDLLDDPQGALDRYFSAKTQGTEQESSTRISALEAQLAQQQFLTRHSDVNEITATEEFSTYLSKSPLRLELAQKAFQGDYVAADQLLTDYKDYASIARPTASQEAQTTRDIEAARAASLEGGHTAAGVQKQTQGKIYRRADLMQLKMQKPEMYGDPEFQREIVKAYQEGRVK